MSQLKPEMILAEDLKDINSRLLLPRETSLTQQHIKMFKMWGVIEADIEETEREDVEEERDAAGHVDEETIRVAEEVIRRRFNHTNTDHPAIRELFRLCTLRKAEEMQSGKKRKVGDPGFGDCANGNIHLKGVSKFTTTKMDYHEFIRNEVKLPTLPNVFVKINETIVNPVSSANDIARVIDKDTALSAQLLKIVNSAFYGFPSRIDTLSRAVAIIGTRQLSALASGIIIIDKFRYISSDIIDMKSFWKHSIVCGVVARIIASYKNIQNTERLFVAGLLHDIGRLILYNYMPDLSLCIFKEARDTEELLYNMEFEIMDYDHAEIGGVLLKKWKLPLMLEDIVKYHHAPQKSQNQLECSIVHMADIVTNAMGMGSSGERFVPPIDPYAWECIGLSANILDLTMNQADCQAGEIYKFFFPNEK